MVEGNDLVTEIHRILTPGGRFVFTTPHLIGSPVLWAFTQVGMVSKEEIEEHHTLFTHKRLQMILRTAGFAPDAIRIFPFQAGMNIYGCADKEDILG